MNILLKATKYNKDCPTPQVVNHTLNLYFSYLTYFSSIHIFDYDTEVYGSGLCLKYSHYNIESQF